MDVTFSCPNCKQELAVEVSAAGSHIECPSCGQSIIVPTPDPANVHVANPIATSAAAKIERHFVVPVHDHPSEALIHKANPPLEVTAREGDKTLHIKCVRRTECVEVGHDRFDEKVSELLGKIGESNIVSINTITYTHLDIGSQKLLTDYGVMIIYRG